MELKRNNFYRLHISVSQFRMCAVFSGSLYFRGRNLEAEEAARNQLNNVPVGAGLQQSVTALLDAMRDLLTNVRPRADREDAADEGDESEGDA